MNGFMHTRGERTSSRLKSDLPHCTYIICVAQDIIGMLFSFVLLAWPMHRDRAALRAISFDHSRGNADHLQRRYEVYFDSWEREATKGSREFW